MGKLGSHGATKKFDKTSDCKGLAVVAHNLNINYLFILLAVIATIGIGSMMYLKNSLINMIIVILFSVLCFKR